MNTTTTDQRKPTAAPRGDSGATTEVTPTVNHYVSKARIARSIVESVAVRAVCGERLIVQSQGEGRTDAPDAIICLDCEWLYSQMKER